MRERLAGRGERAEVERRSVGADGARGMEAVEYVESEEEEDRDVGEEGVGEAGPVSRSLRRWRSESKGIGVDGRGRECAGSMLRSV